MKLFLLYLQSERKAEKYDRWTIRANEAYLQGQLGNPEGPDAPNKKYYDPRVWLRKMEESMSKRLEQSFEDLNCVDVL